MPLYLHIIDKLVWESVLVCQKRKKYFVVKGYKHVIHAICIITLTAEPMRNEIFMVDV